MSNMSDNVAKTVETAREAVAKVGEQVSDFLQGNPFSTAVGKKIEEASDASVLATENWGLNLEICDYANSSPEVAKDAIRAIKKRLQTYMSKNNAVVMYSLTILETCVKNCNHDFHILVCQKDFILDLVKLIGPKYDAPQVIQERVLSLIQAWTDAFKNDPDLQGVKFVYDDLKAKGVEFPARDLDNMAPILTPKRTVAEVLQTLSDAPIEVNSRFMTKLRSELDIVSSNLKIFRQFLGETDPANHSKDDADFLRELHDTLKKMQERILVLISGLPDAPIAAELLTTNDELNSAFEKYDRFKTKQTAGPDSFGVDEMNPRSLSDQLAGLNVTNAAGQSSSGQQVPTESEASQMSDWLERQKTELENSNNPGNDKL